jgi:hypothetical protein
VSNNHPTRHALFARLYNSPRVGVEEASIFYGAVFKTTNTYFWYHGPYSKQSVSRETHRVRFFDDEASAKAELEAIQARSGKAHRDATREAAKQAQAAFLAAQAREVADWSEGTDA